jgi:hypothetical protein
MHFAEVALNGAVLGRDDELQSNRFYSERITRSKLLADTVKARLDEAAAASASAAADAPAALNEAAKLLGELDIEATTKNSELASCENEESVVAPVDGLGA